ncbi:hypothetical protein RRG08_056371 [Elysia crispata]|uniref:Uncharacterized protein n=1 Tax=Elysia crispata TaxID=231223 RepID=A0AAE0ZRM7_9GAST|nr:hypothetical protein RRG08_056371 [Elysia crispata]
MEDTKEHLEIEHKSFVNLLCRICGLRSKKCAQRYLKKKPRQCANHEKTILKLFHIDVQNDGPNHSSTLCDSCYGRIRGFEHKPVTEGMLKAAQSVISDSSIWCVFNAQLTSDQCPLCAHYISLGRAGRKRKVQKTAPVQEETNPNHCNIDMSTSPLCTPDMDQSTFSEVVTSTPKKSRRHLLFEKNPGPSTSTFKEKATSPIRPMISTQLANRITSPIKDGHDTLRQTLHSACDKQLKNIPLNKKEIAVLNSLLYSRLEQLEDDKGLIRIKTKGQPKMYKRFSKPRKQTTNASSPTKKRRSREIKTLRSMIAGRSTEATEFQEESDLRRTTAQRARKILLI